MSRKLASIAIALVAVLAPPAFAEHAGLARARSAMDDNKFEEARDHLRATLRSGELVSEELAQAYLLEGMVELVLADEAADASFRRAVLLVRKIELPDGSAPRFRAALTKARAFVDENGGLRASIARDANIVVVTIENDPIGMVKALAGEGADGKSVVVPAARKVTLAVDGGTIALRDVWGNTVRELAVPEAETTVREPDTIVDEKPPIVANTAWYRKPLGWGIATGAFAVAGGVAWFAASSTKSDLDAIIANSADHTFDEAEFMRDKWRTRVHITDGLFVVAGALAVVTLVALITQPDGRVVVTPANGGAQVGYALRF